MKKVTGKTLVALGAMGLVALGAGSAGAVTYTGSLTSAGGGITGTNEWVDNIIFSWTVSDETNVGFWTYQYRWQDTDLDGKAGGPGNPKNISHLIVEVSPSFTEADVHSDTPDVDTADNDAPHTFSPGPGNPFLPAAFFGLKWDGITGLDFTATLVTPRAPVWGDFYAKDGGGNDADAVTATNTGFLAADPLDLPANGSVQNHVLVPDTVTTPVPEPGTLLLVGTGLAGAGAWSRKRWFGRKSA